MAGFDYDVVVIGSGFGGSVAAFRAAEKGYRVGVMESGKRWNDEDIPKTNWNLTHFLWQPETEMYGIQRIEYLGRRAGAVAAPGLAADLTFTATRCMSRRSSSSTPRNGRASPTGPTNWPLTSTRQGGCSAWSAIPYMPTDVDRYMQQVAIDMGEGKPSTRPRSASTSGARASKPKIRTSAASGRGGPDASDAATA